MECENNDEQPKAYSCSEDEVIKCRSSINCPLLWSIKHTIYYLFMLFTINISTNSSFPPTFSLD